MSSRTGNSFSNEMSLFHLPYKMIVAGDNAKASKSEIQDIGGYKRYGFFRSKENRCRGKVKWPRKPTKRHNPNWTVGKINQAPGRSTQTKFHTREECFDWRFINFVIKNHKTYCNPTDNNDNHVRKRRKQRQNPVPSNPPHFRFAIDTDRRYPHTL